MKLPQTAFAGMLGISVRTVQGWELLRCEQEGAKRVLLVVAKYQPKAIVKAFQLAGKLQIDGGFAP
ncbi:MAG: DNA-binding transcriptional regulator YiaG [Burkholderiaceae bacterium]|jgi:DNA-binding transcriptional regulator YiaG